MSELIRHVALVSDSPAVSFSDVAPVAAALQKQVTRDFGPVWDVQGTVDAFDKLEDVPLDYWPVILRDDIHEKDAAGFHTDKHGQPFSLVQIDASWPLTASHEALEMLADPFGSRVVAGSPPPQAPAEIKSLQRVVYLVEVCDPCEDDSFSYTINGVTVSDFITPNFYDPTEVASVRYSFSGKLKGPHTVANNGYVSFGDPASGEWYQIMVTNNLPKLVELGKLDTSGKSLREAVDGIVLRTRKSEQKQGKALRRKDASLIAPPQKATAERARALRSFIKTL